MELHGEPLPFAGGFVLASLVLHGAGLGLAALAAAAGRHWPVRLAGAGVAAAGLALAASVF
jgi:urease accessory protein